MPSRVERELLGRIRITRILRTYTVACARTLEQKISDAGPSNQRIDPHILTESKATLLAAGRIARLKRIWFHLTETPAADVEKRLSALEPLHDALQRQPLTDRMGQALEIAIYRALCAQDRLDFLGGFLDLDEHDDGKPYRKDEPPNFISGRRILGRLDFLVRHPTAGWAGIEAKNVREWMYPDREEITELLAKCLSLDIVPVLIARRIPYVTRRLLEPCGVILWETFRQRYPSSEAELASKCRDKNLLGYHDILLGNDPDPMLTRFVSEFLPADLPAARERFVEQRDLLAAYSSGDMPYDEFSARVRRREDGTDEDSDWYL